MHPELTALIRDADARLRGATQWDIESYVAHRLATMDLTPDEMRVAIGNLLVAKVSGDLKMSLIRDNAQMGRNILTGLLGRQNEAMSTT